MGYYAHNYWEDTAITCDRCRENLTEDSMVVLKPVSDYFRDITVCEACEEEILKEEIENCEAEWKSHIKLIPACEDQNK